MNVRFSQHWFRFVLIIGAAALVFCVMVYYGSPEKPVLKEDVYHPLRSNKLIAKNNSRKKSPNHIEPVVNNSGLPSPFYVHYIRFKPDDGKVTFRFIDYLSVKSAIERLQPDGILVHGGAEPSGEYWEYFKSKKLIEHRFREPIRTAGQRMGKPKEVGWKEHSADIAKLDVLLEHGGVAIDFDVFFVRGNRIKEILRSKKIITCYGDEDGYNIGFIAAHKDSKLLYAWRRSYQDIYVKDWNFNQAFVSKYLSVLYRDETYVANHVCNNPHPYNLGDYFNNHGKLKWSNSLAIHSYERHGGVKINSPEDLNAGTLTTHKEFLKSINEDLPLPEFDNDFRDEIDPLTDKLKQ